MRRCSAGDSFREREREHLDLVELVDAEDPPGVAAGRAGLAPEAGGDAAVPARQVLGGEDLVAVQAGERDLGGADQVQVVVGGGVDRGPVGGKEARAPHGLLPHQHGGHDRREPGGLDPVERQRHQRHLHAHQRAEQVGEAAAGHARRGLQVEGPGGAGQLHVVARREPEGRRLADPAQLDGILLAPVGRVRLGEVGQRHQQPVAIGLEVAQLGLQRRELVAQAPGLGLLGGAVATLAPRLANRLADAGALRAGRLDARAEPAGVLVQPEQALDLAAGASPRQVRGDALRLGADQLQVEQAGPVRPRRRPDRVRGRRPPPRGRPRTRTRAAAR